MTAYFAGGTAYVVAAYLAGARLDRSQILVMNLIFLVYAALCAVGALGNYSRMIELSTAVRALSPHRMLLASERFLWIMTAKLIAGIAVAMKFMWDVRHRRAQKRADAGSQPQDA